MAQAGDGHLVWQDSLLQISQPQKEPSNRFLVTTCHKASTVAGSFDTSAGSEVDEMYSLVAKCSVATD
jgi:hypothetical protein